MLDVLRSSWALLLGLTLLMLGNGMQNTVLGIRGGIEGFSTMELSVVMSGYFAGFLLASKIAPRLIGQVGHVRVFAALGSLISAAIVLYPVLTNPIAWTALRVLIGFCFCGVYITAESWLNAASTNETRGKALSLYMIVVMLGIVLAQGHRDAGRPLGLHPLHRAVGPRLDLLRADPAGRDAHAALRIHEVHVARPPLGDLAARLRLRLPHGQHHLGPVHDDLRLRRRDRAVRRPDLGLHRGDLHGRSRLPVPHRMALGPHGPPQAHPVVRHRQRHHRRRRARLRGRPRALILLGFLFGGLSNPVYSLAVAYTNDFLGREHMAAASGGLLFLNGLGAVLGPIAVGWIMDAMGAPGFWVFLVVLNVVLALYALWRMRRRPVTPDATECWSFAPPPLAAAPVARTISAETVAAVEEEPCAEDTKSQIERTA